MIMRTRPLKGLKMKPRIFKEKFPKASKTMEGVVGTQLAWTKNFSLDAQTQLDVYCIIRSCLRETWIHGYKYGKREAQDVKKSP